MNKNKHLSEDERFKIQYALDHGESFKQIARHIGRDCTTISKEIRLHRVFKQSGSFGETFNDCSFRIGCSENNLCPGAMCRAKLCRRCTRIPCRKLCPHYERQICGTREKPPYVCNGCDTRKKCSLEKALYSARNAYKEYADTLSEARSGICADENEIKRLDEMFSDRLLNGQSIHHICGNSADSVMWSEKSIYKYVGLGLLRAKNVDMARKVRFRPRKSKHESLKVDKKCRTQRTYSDYLAYMEANPDTMVVEMDTVHGTVGGKCLLTLHFVSANFMLAYIMDNCTAHSVRSQFARLRHLLGNDDFGRLFALVLTDNGSEFSDPRAIEVDENGELLSSVFYCDPGQSQQKGAAEVNHQMIRRVIPKGVSMDGYSQQDICLMMNHINSYGRAVLNERAPYRIFELIFGCDIVKKLGAELVSADKIILRPSLLK